MISPHTARRRPVAGSLILANRPKSTSATTPGAVSSMRTVGLAAPAAQFRFRTKRRNDGYDTVTPPRCQQLPDAASAAAGHR